MKCIDATRRAARLATVVFTLAIAGPVAFAQQPSPAAMSTAKDLIAATGATQLFTPLIAGVIEQAKLLYLQQNPQLAKDLNEIAAKMRANLQPRFGELTDEVARLYASSFTEQELKDILAFYKSPAGQKLLQAQPKVIDLSMGFAQGWANKLSDEVVGKMREELKKKGHAM